MSDEQSEFTPVEFKETARSGSVSEQKDTARQLTTPVETFQATVFGGEKRKMDSEQTLFSPRQAEKPESSPLPSNFWSCETRDGQFSSEVEKIIQWEIDKRVQGVLKQRIAELDVTYVEPKQKEAFETGYSEGKKKAEVEFELLKSELSQEMAGIKESLQGHIDAFLEEKQQLLVQHQAHWLQSLSELMKKFLIKNAGRIDGGISNWLQMQVANYKSDERVRFFISELEFERLKKHGFTDLPGHCEFIKESSLKDGEVKVETRSGGLFFSAESEMKKLEELLTELCQGDSQGA